MDDGSTDDNWRIIASKMAQHLANLLERPVAGFEPEPMINDGPSADEIVDRLISGQYKPKPFHTYETNPQAFNWDATFIILSGLMNGSPDLKRRILHTLKESMFQDEFDARIFCELRALVVKDAMTDESIDSLRRQIPELWNDARQEILRGRLKAGIFYRWYQMIHWKCDEQVVERAIQVILTRVSEKK